MLLCLLVVVMAAVMVAAASAEFNDMEKNTINTTNAEVKIGDMTGFPMNFNDLVPGVWSGWQSATIKNGSTIAMDIYVGLQDKGWGGADLKNKLDVQIQRWDGAAWVWVYNGDVIGLFAAWQQAADDTPAGNIVSYQVQVRLAQTAGNDLQGGKTYAWILIYGVQYNGTAPVTAPWNYTPLP